MTTKTLRLPNKKKMTSSEVKQFSKTVNSFITINKKRRDLLKQENAFKESIHTMLDKYNMKSFTLEKGSGVERITITKDKLDKDKLIIDGLYDKYQMSYSFNQLNVIKGSK